MIDRKERQRRDELLALIHTYNPATSAKALDAQLDDQGWKTTVEAVRSTLHWQVQHGGKSAQALDVMIGEKERRDKAAEFWNFGDAARYGHASKQLDDGELVNRINALAKADGVSQKLIDALTRKLGRDATYQLLVTAHGSEPKMEVKP